MNTVFKNIYPRQVWTNNNYNPAPCQCEKGNNFYPPINNDERFGGFLLPFVAGAAISAPFWLAAGSNKSQQVYYPYPPQQYPYYPVYMNNNYPGPNPQYIKKI